MSVNAPHRERASATDHRFAFTVSDTDGETALHLIGASRVCASDHRAV